MINEYSGNGCEHYEGAKIQFQSNKTAEREGRTGLLEISGSPENVDHAMQLVWDVLQLVGKEYSEIPFPRRRT